jgi:hypothetical protein
MKPELGMSSEHGEVGIGVQKLGPGFDRYSGDETVDQLSDSFAAHATGTIQPRCGVIVCRRGGQDRGSPQQPTKLGEVMFVAGAGEDFHRHWITDGEIVTEEAIDGIACR